MSTALKLQTSKAPDSDSARTNKIYVSKSNLDKITTDNHLVSIKGFLFIAESSPKVDDKSVGFNTQQRMLLSVSLQEEVTLKLVKPGNLVTATSVDLEMTFFTVKEAHKVTFQAPQLREAWRTILGPIPFNITQVYIFKYEGATYLCKCLSLEGSILNSDGDMEPYDQPGSAIFSPNMTTINFKKQTGSPITIEDDTKGRASTIFQPNFNFADLGIGGLDTQFAVLFRRAFNSRLYPPKIVRERGIQHVKGILLYGPPGTGKTLMARQIGKMLNTVEPKIISGPEIFNKYVGESEAKIRELFADAIKDRDENGDNAQLHLIIFDEIDSICKKRSGGGSAGTDVGDKVVNQLLSMIDGVEALDDILLIGMTNRRDLIDDALLRPGRLEVQIRVGLPDEHGREQIFGIHTAKLRQAKAMADDISLPDLAAQTPNYTGAEIAGVVKSAQSYALNAGFDPKTMQLIPGADLTVTRQHFELALQEVRPAFGVEDDIIGTMAQRGLVDYSTTFTEKKEHMLHLINSLIASDRQTLMTFCISGPPAAGLSAFSASVALKSGFSYIKVVKAKQFIGQSEDSTCQAILGIFEDAYKSPISAVILDDMNALIEYSPIGPRFANKTLQAICVLLKQVPPEGHKLAVFVTTSMREQMNLIGVDSRYFYDEIYLTCLASIRDIIVVAKEACDIELEFSTEDMADGDTFLSSNPIPIKRAIEALDFAAYEAKDEPISWAALKFTLQQHTRH